MTGKNQKIKDILKDKKLKEHNSYVEVLAWVPGPGDASARGD